MIRHAEPARARAQNGDTELAAVDELADQARQQALFFELAVGQRAEEILKIRVQLFKQPRRKAPEVHRDRRLGRVDRAVAVFLNVADLAVGAGL